MSSLSFRGVIIQVKAGKKEAGAVIGSAQSKLPPPRTNPRELLPVTKSRLSRFYHFLYLKCESRGGGTQLSAQDPYGSSLAIPSQLQRCHLLISWMLFNPVRMDITSSSLLSQRSPNCFSLHSLLFLAFYSRCCDSFSLSFFFILSLPC